MTNDEEKLDKEARKFAGNFPIPLSVYEKIESKKELVEEMIVQIYKAGAKTRVNEFEERNEPKGCKFDDNLLVSCADCVNREETLKAAKQLIKEMYDSWNNGINDCYLGLGDQIFRKARKFLEENECAEQVAKASAAEIKEE